MLPERVRTVEFVQGTLDHLVIRLPGKKLVEETLERMLDPVGGPELPRYRSSTPTIAAPASGR